MNKIPNFTLSFLEDKPVAAARILERLSPTHTAALLEKLSLSIGYPVFENMFPGYAALCLQHLPIKLAGDLIREIPTRRCVSILRMVPEPTVKEIFDQLPVAKSTILKKQMAYPHNTVGAWMNLDFVEVTSNLNVADSRKLLRKNGNRLGHEVFVAEDDGTFLGTIKLSDLAIAKDSRSITRFLQLNDHPLSDRSTLMKVTNNPDWEKFDSLPVIDRKGKLIGELNQNTLKRALTQENTETLPGDLDSLVTNIARAYALAFSKVVESITSLPILNKSSPIGFKNGK